MKNLDKGTKITLWVFIIYAIVLLIIFLPGYLRNKHNTLYIIDNSGIKIKLEEGKWSNIEKIKDYNLKKFNIYEDENLLGEYKITYSNRFHLFDDSGKEQDYKGQIFAYRGKAKLEVIFVPEFNELTDSDKTIIQKALTDNKLTSNFEFNLMQKVSYDIDNDGEEEIIYNLNNYYIDNNDSDIFSLMFMYDNNEIKVIDKDVVKDNKVYEHPMYEIKKLFDIKKDGKYEVMYSQLYFSNPDDECAVLYNLNNNKTIKNFCE